MGKNIESGFLTKNKTFSFAKPVTRGPQSVLEKSFEKEESSAESSEGEADNEVEMIASKPLHSETSSSDNSPDSTAFRSKLLLSSTVLDSKRQKTPQSSLEVVSAQPDSSTNLDTWECSSCMVPNKASDDKCVCCGTPKGGTTTQTESWECPSCMVHNNASAKQCVCCATASPHGNDVAALNNKPAAPAFKPTDFSKPVNSQGELFLFVFKYVLYILLFSSFWFSKQACRASCPYCFFCCSYTFLIWK